MRLQVLGPLLRRSVCDQAVERRLGGRDRPVDVGRGARGDVAHHLLGGGVDDVDACRCRPTATQAPSM